METILKAQNITKSYKMGKTTLDVLRGADLSVKKGEFVAVIVGSAVLACMIGALVPGLQAARKKPVQSLQVNQL